MEQKLSIAQQVRDYVQKKPFVKEALEQGIVNYSSLAKQISKELRKKNVSSVKVALIRESKKQKKKKKFLESKVVSILRESKFSLLSKISAIESNKSLRVNSIAFSKTPSFS